MPSYLQRIGSAVPATAYEQDFVRDTVAGWLGADRDRRLGRLVGRVFDRAGIDRRYSVLTDFERGEGPFLDGGRYAAPSTSARNEIYAREANRLAAQAARRALHGTEPASVTHVVTVSCTGFMAPGPDVHLVRSLGLDPSVQRTHVGFMGCYGAFPGLRLAHAFCAADPAAVVLVCSVELCTLHFDPQTHLDSLLSTALFADGAAAAVVSGAPPAKGVGFALDAFSTTLTDHDDEMAWTIGDRGFRMRLSGAIPRLVRGEVTRALEPLWQSVDAGPEDVDAWAVHPGGPAVLDAVEDAFCLDDDALAASRGVLAQYGNMSSATILFVLEALRRGRSETSGRVAAMAFGPGLTLESAVLRFV